MKYLKVTIFLIFLVACYKTDPDVLSLLKEIKSQNDELKIQMTQLQSRTDSLANSLKNTNLSLINIDKKVDSLKSQISVALTQINVLNGQLTLANANIADIQNKIADLQLKCAELVRLLEELLNISTGSIIVTTELSSVSSSPLIIGGNVIVTGIDTIYEKGIIISTNNNLTIDTIYGNLDFDPSPTQLLNLSKGGWRLPTNKKLTVKSKLGRGNFLINLQGATGNTTYYVRAYAKNKTSVFYGDTQIFTTSNFIRDPRQWDIANVFWSPSSTLFDYYSDEIITPDANGVYTFWYTSNEDPRVYSTTRSAASVPNLLFYKFKTQENCQKWCDLKTGRTIPSN
jgi:hypothetical protein